MLTKVWRRRENCMGLFFRGWSRLLSSSEGKYYCFSIPRYNTMLLGTVWESPFLFQHDCTSVHKARSKKTWLDEFGVEKLDWSTQSPDLNLIKHLWDELKLRLRARLSHPKSIPDPTNAWAKNNLKILWKASPKECKML